MTELLITVALVLCYSFGYLVHAVFVAPRRYRYGACMVCNEPMVAPSRSTTCLACRSVNP